MRQEQLKINDFIMKVLNKSLSRNVKILDLGSLVYEHKYSDTYYYWAKFDINGFVYYLHTGFDAYGEHTYEDIISRFNTEIEEVIENKINKDPVVLTRIINRSLETKYRCQLKKGSLGDFAGITLFDKLSKYVSKLVSSNHSYAEIFNKCHDNENIIAIKYRN